MNSVHDHAGEPCPEYAFELLELQGPDLAPDREALLRRHLSGCARCRAYVADWQRLDATLAAALPRPELSAGFDLRLRETIESTLRSPARATARDAAEQEYRRALMLLRRGLGWFTALESVAAASIGGVLGLGLQQAWPELSQAVFSAGGAGPWQGRWGAGLVALLAIGTVFAWRRLATTDVATPRAT